MAIPDGISKGVRKGVLMYVGSEFTLTFDRTFMSSYRQEYLMFIELVKRLRNYRFDDRKLAWNIPLSDASAKLMVQLIGWGVQATKSATDALGVEMKRTAEVAAAKQAAEEEHVELDIPTAKDLASALRNYQRAGVKFMGTTERFYLADEMGLGKTAQVLAVLEMKRAFPAVILCPPKLKQNWLIECRKWLPHRRASVRHLDLAEITVIAYTEAHKFVNVGLVSTKKKERDAAAQDPKKWFFPTHSRPVAVICDEAHQIKNRASRRTMAALAIAKLCDCWIRGALSGTPIENKHSEWLAPLEFLGVLDRLGGWHPFVTRYCGARYQSSLGIWDTSGSTNGRELYERLSQICYIRRLKKDHLKDLPDKIQQVQFAEIDNETKYRQIERDVGAYLMSSNGGRMLTQGQTDAQGMIKLGLLRHACGVGKVAWAVEWIETFLESGEKFVVYAHHREVMEALRIGLKAWNPAFIGGGCEDVTREIEKFKTPTCRVMIASITGAGFGINGMQEVCSHIGILELMWTQTKHDQAVDRLHRIGQKDCVNAYYFIAEGTIDEEMWAVLCDKSRIFASTVDGEDDNKKTVLERIGAKFMHRAA